MYYVATKFKNEDKTRLSGPFEAHNLAEQAMVNLLARNDVEQCTVVSEEELEPDAESENDKS